MNTSTTYSAKILNTSNAKPNHKLVTSENYLKNGFNISSQYQSRFNVDASQLRASYISTSLGYKLTKTFSLEADIRFGTSNSWDCLRYGIGLTTQYKIFGFNFAAKIKYQYQHYLQSMPEFGINSPINNIRLKLEAERKITKKLKAFISSEPLYRIEASSGFFRRIRNGLGLQWTPIKRITIEASYLFQPEWNSRNTLHVSQCNLAYTLPKKWNRKNPKE